MRRHFVVSLACLGVLVGAPVSAFAAPGDLDITFDGDGLVTTDFPSVGQESVTALVRQPDGKLVAAGGLGFGCCGFGLARYEVNGSPDSRFPSTVGSAGSRSPASTFPIGTTSVACTATDASANSARESVSVHVRGATEQLENLLVRVQPFGGKLASKLERARAALAAGKAALACHYLRGLAYQVEVQSGRTLTPEEAEELIASAARIEAVIGC